MKIGNWTRKLSAALVAGGLFFVSPAHAADLDVNLVLNPGFESVDENDAGPFTSVRILDWADDDGDGDDTFAYPYSSNYSGSPAPADSGVYHFTGGFGTVEGGTLISQQVDLSSGDTATAIADGTAGYNLSGYFSSYREQGEASSLRLRFLDAADAELGAAQVGGVDFVASIPITGNQVDWGFDSARGLIPAGTESVSVDVLSGGAAGNYDGYLDNVHFSVSVIPEPTSIVLAAMALAGGILLLPRRKA